PVPREAPLRARIATSDPARSDESIATISSSYTHGKPFRSHSSPWPSTVAAPDGAGAGRARPAISARRFADGDDARARDDEVSGRDRTRRLYALHPLPGHQQGPASVVDADP